MTGVPPLHDGSSIFQMMFSPVFEFHFVGKFFESLIPLPAGPRHCGQLSLAMAATHRKLMTVLTQRRRGAENRKFTDCPYEVARSRINESASCSINRRFASWVREFRSRRRL